MSGANAVAIIPARLGSTRFPEKVLAARTGKPLIQHVYEAAARAGSLSRIVIAADDPRVRDAARAFGAEAVLTDAAHPNGTSRLAQAAQLLGLARDQVIVNVQGDEPELDPLVIDQSVDALARGERLKESRVRVATAAADFSSSDDPLDPNCVKVVCALNGMALYFSRSLVPFDRDAKSRGPSPHARPMRHVGIYVYRREFLEQYAAMSPTPLEQTEQLEQLRVLEHGWGIAVARVAREAVHAGIDTPEQYEAFVARWSRAQNDRRPGG